MILSRLFEPSAEKVAGRALYEAVTRQARQPVFYTAFGVPDTVEGRFELYTLHVVLLLHRLSKPQTQGVAQALFDAYVQALDDALREMGVGDLTVPKRMRKLAEAFYGRAKAYRAALEASDSAALEALIARTLFADADDTSASAALCAYVEHCVAALAGAPDEALLAAHPPWPEPDAEAKTTETAP